MDNKDLVTIMAVGDVGPNRDDPPSLFAHVADVLKAADITFGQLETNFSERGCRAPHAEVPLRSHPSNAVALKTGGFDVVSFASNHCMDWCADAFFDTIKNVKSQGVEIIGVGKDIEEARKPAIFERKGTKIAFLAYSSILPRGYWADVNKPGAAPMRGLTLYEQIEPDQPGTPCRIQSFANEADLAAMVEDIKKAKAQADIVCVSHHYGIHLIPATLAQYQLVVAHAAIDAGAEVVFGSHAHILKPVEVYRGKVIFHSLCNFAFDVHIPLEHKFWQVAPHLNPDLKFDPEYPVYPFPPDSRQTVAAKVLVSDKKIQRISFLPVYINPDSTPRFLKRDDARFAPLVKYMRDITEQVGLETQYVVEGDEVVITK